MTEHIEQIPEPIEGRPEGMADQPPAERFIVDPAAATEFTEGGYEVRITESLTHGLPVITAHRGGMPDMPFVWRDHIHTTDEEDPFQVTKQAWLAAARSGEGSSDDTELGRLRRLADLLGPLPKELQIIEPEPTGGGQAMLDIARSRADEALGRDAASRTDETTKQQEPGEQ